MWAVDKDNTVWYKNQAKLEDNLDRKNLSSSLVFFITAKKIFVHLIHFKFETAGTVGPRYLWSFICKFACKWLRTGLCMKPFL